MSRLHDRLHLLKVVDVECRDAVAVFGSMVEQKPKRNERHRKNLIRNLDGKTPPGDDFTYLCSNCHQAHPNKPQGLVKFDSVSVGVTGDKQLFIRRRLRASNVFAA